MKKTKGTLGNAVLRGLQSSVPPSAKCANVTNIKRESKFLLKKLSLEKMKEKNLEFPSHTEKIGAANNSNYPGTMGIFLPQCKGIKLYYTFETNDIPFHCNCECMFGAIALVL